MGSLTPGWDAANGLGLPPPELREADDSLDKPVSYFERLETRKLERRSAEAGAAPPSTLPHAATMPVHKTIARRSVEYKPSMTLSRTSADYSATDWTQELDSLRTSASHPTPFRKVERTFKRSQPDESHSWWRTLDTGLMNEKPDEEHRPGDEHGSFTPQFAVAGHGLSLDLESGDK